MIRLVCVIEFPTLDTVEDAQARISLLDGGSQWLGKLAVYHASEAEADTALYRQDDTDEERCTSTCSQMRCELQAGHGRFHKSGTAGWDDGEVTRG